MVKISCIFDNVDDAEFAKVRILHECGGECDIADNLDEDENSVQHYALPSNLAETGAWQMITPIIEEHSKVAENKKCRMSYIGLDSQAKKAEALLINLGGRSIKSAPFPRG